MKQARLIKENIKMANKVHLKIKLNLSQKRFKKTEKLLLLKNFKWTIKKNEYALLEMDWNYQREIEETT